MIFAEEPTYFLAKSIFEDFKLKVVQIAMEDDGLNLDALEHELQSREAQQQHLPKVVYTGKTKKGMNDDLVMTLMIAVFWGREFLAKRIAGVPYSSLK